jgi:transposase
MTQLGDEVNHLHVPTCKSVACFGAVSLRTGTFVRSLCATFNAATFETFLKTLLRHRTHSTRMVLVLDNARYHHAVLLKPVRRTYRAVLILLFLPPSVRSWPPSSESGSWHARLATHNRFFATLNDVLTAVSTCFDRWRKPNPVLRRLCGIS